MAHKLPTETIVFAVSFLLIGAEFVLMGDSDEHDLMARQTAVQASARHLPEPEPEPGTVGPRPDFMPEETEVVEEEAGFDDDEAFDDEVAFGQPLDNTRPLVSTSPEFDEPFSAEPEFDDGFDGSFGMPTMPDPMTDDLGE